MRENRMVEKGKNRPEARQITYRVGWKRGTIEGRSSGKQGVSGTEIQRVPKWIVGFLENIVWRPVPFLPQRFLFLWLAAVPVISFVFTFFLVYMISTGADRFIQ